MFRNNIYRAVWAVIKKKIDEGQREYEAEKKLLKTNFLQDIKDLKSIHLFKVTKAEQKAVSKILSNLN